MNGSFMTEEKNAKLHTEWLDETGGIPDVSGWLDETNALPDMTEWLDETGVIPKIVGQPEDRECSGEEAFEHEEASESAAEWLDETGILTVPEETEEAVLEPFELDGEETDGNWKETKEEDEIPHLRPGEWDDTLDEEPEGWFSENSEDGRNREIPEEERGISRAEQGECAEAGKDVRNGNASGEKRSAWRILPGQKAADAAVYLLAAGIAAAVIGGALIVRANRRISEEKALLATAGEVLSGDQALHTQTLQKLADLRIQEEKAKQEAAEQLQKQEEEKEKLEEAEGSVEVEFTLSTIQSDLKVKIRRKKEQSLIGGVPFRIQVKGPDGKVSEKEDSDEDGILYLDGLANGTYEVSLRPLLDLEAVKAGGNYQDNEDYRSYSRYQLPTSAQSIDVTDHIAYEVVDVADEVKSASEVNVAKEDTAKNDTPVESVIRDTVEWVESTRTEIGEEGADGGYEEVDKSSVPDPYASAAGNLTAADFRKLSSADSLTDEGSTQSAGDSSSESSSGEDTASSEEAGSNGSEENQEEKKNPSLSVDPSEIHLTEGGTQSIRASVSDAENTAVTYSSSDESVATVSDGGTVQAKQAGKCEIRVSLDGYSDITRTVPVTVTEKTDDSAALKDKDGNPLYVRDGDSYRAATAGDYSRYDTFYRKIVTEKKYRYTGWQHLNGLTYYYDKNGNYVTGTQIIQGITYTFSSEGILSAGDTKTGIDVSFWNGKINWSEVASSGISFAIIRCGYRGSSAGMLVRDSAVETNITGAKNAGLKVGLYFFSQAVNEAEAVEEASMAVQIAKSYGISLPVFLDVESSGGRGDAISTSQRTANIAAFCRTVQNAGLSAGVYANTNWFNEKINTGALTSYHIWLAQYAASPSYSRTRYDLWQYSSTGKVNGIDGDVDLNISYRSY